MDDKEVMLRRMANKAPFGGEDEVLGITLGQPCCQRESQAAQAPNQQVAAVGPCCKDSVGLDRRRDDGLRERGLAARHDRRGVAQSASARPQCPPPGPGPCPCARLQAHHTPLRA